MDFSSKKRSLIFVSITLFALFTLSIGFVFRSGSVLAVSTKTAAVDPGHQVLPANDGWAAASGGTTGGSTATSAHVYTVTTRAQLVQDLGGAKSTDSTAKIIYISGTIYGNQDNSGNMSTCSSYGTGGYSLSAYLAAYNPSVWGRSKKPSGPQESARAASENKQAASVEISIPSNTTLVGIGNNADIIGANFIVKSANNVIIRNLNFENASDCFPQWDPTDGATGNWNSAFDNISILNNSTHVWIDHNVFTDANQPDSSEPTYFGRLYEQHDGECDITKGADLVTVSWNRFLNHDKTMLIGSSDSLTSDSGKLRVTISNNEFNGTLERTPRVRFGEVHVYNNYYNQGANPAMQYALGVGIDSQIYDQNNYFQLASNLSAADIINVYSGTRIYSTGDIVNGSAVNPVTAYNAVNSPKLSTSVGWTPTYYNTIVATSLVPARVENSAGTGHTLTED
jgi:pectate lyase